MNARRSCCRRSECSSLRSPTAADELVALPGGLGRVPGRAHHRHPAALSVGEPALASTGTARATSTSTCAGSTCTPTTTACRSTARCSPARSGRSPGSVPGPRSARLAARFDFGAHDDLLASFPFPHELAVDVTLAASGLRVVDHGAPERAGQRPGRVRLASRTCSSRDRDRRLVGARAPRARQRRASTGAASRPAGPVRCRPRRAPLAGRRPRRPLRARAGPRAHARVRPTGGSRSPTTTATRTRRCTRRPGTTFCAIEPMTAPTNALVTGDSPTVRPGETFSAAFTLARQPPTRRPTDRGRRSGFRLARGRREGGSMTAIAERPGPETAASPYLEGVFAPIDTEIDAECAVDRRAPRRSRRRVRAQRLEPEVRSRRVATTGSTATACCTRCTSRTGTRRTATATCARRRSRPRRRRARRSGPASTSGPTSRHPGGPFKDTANTDLVFHAGRLLALWWLGGPCYQVALPSLETVGQLRLRRHADEGPHRAPEARPRDRRAHGLRLRRAAAVPDVQRHVGRRPDGAPHRHRPARAAAAARPRDHRAPHDLPRLPADVGPGAARARARRG